jgi:hypothetical protein
VSLAEIREGLYYTLQVWGPWLASEISTCDFGILESVSSCGIVFMPSTDTSFEETGFGTTDADDTSTWSIEGGLYIKDTGDPRALLNKVWLGHDDLRDTLRKDRRLNNTADNSILTGMSFDPTIALEVGGALWAQIKFKIQAVEFE